VVGEAAARVYSSRLAVLLTWNCRHLANAGLLRELARYLGGRDYEIPVITTPEELMGE